MLGPWVTSKALNAFTGAFVWVIVMLSIILTASVMYPDISSRTIVGIHVGGTVLAAMGYSATAYLRRTCTGSSTFSAELSSATRANREAWRMPPLEDLPEARLTLSNRIWMGVLRLYLVTAVGLVIIKVVQVVLQ